MLQFIVSLLSLLKLFRTLFQLLIFHITFKNFYQIRESPLFSILVFCFLCFKFNKIRMQLDNILLRIYLLNKLFLPMLSRCICFSMERMGWNNFKSNFFFKNDLLLAFLQRFLLLWLFLNYYSQIIR